MRIGIDIGGTDTKIGLVDVRPEADRLCAYPDECRTPGRGSDPVDRRDSPVSSGEERIAMDQCVGAGIGVPGTVDRKNGVVRYSNNIRWEEVPLEKEMGRYLPIPVKIANDADCAALGEAIAGAGKDCSDVVMLTLGTASAAGSSWTARSMREEASAEASWAIWLSWRTANPAPAEEEAVLKHMRRRLP